jgi:hypothetical protein
MNPSSMAWRIEYRWNGRSLPVRVVGAEQLEGLALRGGGEREHRHVVRPAARLAADAATASATGSVSS